MSKKSESNERQMTLFESTDLQVVPESRKKTLAKIEKERGKEIATARAMNFEAFRAVTDACKDRIERFGSGSPNFYMTVARQHNSAVGVKKIDEANLGQLGGILILRHHTPMVMRSAKTAEEERQLRADLCKKVKAMMAEISQIGADGKVAA